MPVPGIAGIRHSSPTGLWSLNATARGKWFCFALGVPHSTIQSTCATRSQINSEHILIHAGATGQRGRNADADVVYGVVAPMVKSLTVSLSDCTRLHVSLNTRPLFWTFVPHAKVAHRIVPTRFRAKVGSRFLGWPLGTARCKTSG
jgi:hypothetical protein